MKQTEKRNEKKGLGYVHAIPVARTLRCHDEDYNLLRERQNATLQVESQNMDIAKNPSPISNLLTHRS